MPKTSAMTEDEVKKIKFLIDKKLTVPEIQQIVKRSTTTIRRVELGQYDYLLEDEKEIKTAESTNSESDFLARADDLKKQHQAIIGRMVSLSIGVSGLGDALQRYEDELKQINKTLKLITNRLNEISTDYLVQKMYENDTPKQEPPKEDKEPESEFLKWGEVVRRTVEHCDRLSAKTIKRTKATINGDTVTIQCDDATKKYLDRHATLVVTMKKQAQVICGYPIEIKW